MYGLQAQRSSRSAPSRRSGMAAATLGTGSSRSLVDLPSYSWYRLMQSSSSRTFSLIVPATAGDFLILAHPAGCANVSRQFSGDGIHPTISTLPRRLIESDALSRTQSRSFTTSSRSVARGRHKRSRCTRRRLAHRVARQHRANFDLWHIEDEARTPGATRCRPGRSEAAHRHHQPVAQ